MVRLWSNKAIQPDISIGLFLLRSSVILKRFLLVAVIMDEFSDALAEEEVKQALVKEQLAIQLRRAFMKYIFHEVTTPLNSMVMGLEIYTAREHTILHLDANEIDLLQNHAFVYQLRVRDSQ